VLHSFDTFSQLASIEGSTLRAPEGEADDRADAYALACQACQFPVYVPYTGPLILHPDVPFEVDGDPNESVLDWMARRGGSSQKPSDWRGALVDLGIDLDGDWERPWYER
jgi:hypothetical protein